MLPFLRKSRQNTEKHPTKWISPEGKTASSHRFTFQSNRKKPPLLRSNQALISHIGLSGPSRDHSGAEPNHTGAPLRFSESLPTLRHPRVRLQQSLKNYPSHQREGDHSENSQACTQT